MARMKYWMVNIVALTLFLLDILLKKIFSNQLVGEYFIFGDILKLKLATNPGIAFGIGLNYYVIIFLYIIILPILGYALWKQYQQKNSFNILGLTFIITGSISNLIDRFFSGAVVDYIDLKYYSVFNLADVMIVGGVVIIIIVNNFKKPDK